MWHRRNDDRGWLRAGVRRHRCDAAGDGPPGAGRGRALLAGSVALAQKRLAIIDLSTGDQPLFGPQGTALVCNGEIYNYVELKQEAHGYNFATTPIASCRFTPMRATASSFARPLRGMYGIALDDQAIPELYLSRDPFGIKPLYYTEGPFGFAFASEPQAFIRAGLVSPHVVSAKASELLQLQFTTGSQTIFDGIQRVLPGETLGIRAARLQSQIRKPRCPMVARSPTMRARAIQLSAYCWTA